MNLITNTRKNMKPKAMKILDYPILRKQFIIEIVFDKLKNISQIEHSRCRGRGSFMLNLIAASSVL
uniref:transposase n=3 Tax=Candidatus Enterovibrio escicola TaxID=1927127 RepID=UPI002958C001|nr:transposase [Candidatus Enterovibrio escacola]